MDLKEVIASFGTQAAQGAAGVVPLNVPFRRIICCGMGGSSVAGEMLSLVRDDVVVHWDSGLPAGVGMQDLVICTSWSGTTMETIAGYDAARALGVPVVVITTGGPLGEKAKADGVTTVTIPNPEDLRPRFGAGYMTGALFALLGMTDKLVTVDGAALEPAGKALAEAIGSKVPVFYTAHPWRKIGGWFKTLFNENTKHHAWASNFPSAAHNEIEGWAGPYKDSMIPVLVGDTGINGKGLLAILGPVGYTVPTVVLPGDNALTKAFSGYILALWTSYHVATTFNIDPSDIDWIEKFKAEKAK